jgi:uncharacterized protein YyaL (SSP411 family)
MPTNRLIEEKSPYLLQHAHNPVDWYPWGEAAFAKARQEDKPIFLSVGYSTCHWCHVMERESFENEATAAILNRDFVCIKVDREERPDVDRIYMLFVQATTGSGGWPMSVWMTPDLKPFYGGTYFPPDSRYGRPGFPHVLAQLSQAWREQRGKLVDSSIQILAQLESHTAVTAGVDGVDSGAIETCVNYLRRSYDKHYGGFGNAPKFPRPVVLNFLFRYFYRTGDEDARDMALHTLRAMAEGGMHDQMGGGFHRYSVDEHWFVPHFEKMLYDQAQLATSYLEAYQITGDQQYAGTARAIFEYVLRDMTHPAGGFYSAEDADSVIDPAHPHDKGEGAFYIWTQAELLQLLGTDLGLRFADTYGVKKNGNVDSDPHGEFTGRNILYVNRSGLLSADELESSRTILLEARNRRVRPHLDDKILTSWNAMMISALARGSRVLDEPRYLEAAQRADAFLKENLVRAGDGQLLRRWRDGEGAIEAFLDDYAALIQAQIDLFEAVFDTKHLNYARELALKLLSTYEDKQHGAFFSAPPSDDLVMRLKEDYDGAEPSGNSVAVNALLQLADYTGERAFEEAATDALSAFSSRISQQSVTIPQMLCALIRQGQPKSEITFTGEAAELRREANRHFQPFLILKSALGETPSAVVCKDFVCSLPVSTPAELGKLLG